MFGDTKSNRLFTEIFQNQMLKAINPSFSFKPYLARPGGGGGIFIFIPLSLLDQILLAEFFSKISKLFWR
jgi:hypothetical protein